MFFDKVLSNLYTSSRKTLPGEFPPGQFPPGEFSPGELPPYQIPTR